MMRGGCPPQTKRRPEAVARSRGARSLPNGHEVTKGGELLGPDAHHVPQCLRRVESSPTLPLVEDPLGEAGPDARQPRELSDRGAVEIERTRIRGRRSG